MALQRLNAAQAIDQVQTYIAIARHYFNAALGLLEARGAAACGELGSRQGLSRHRLDNRRRRVTSERSRSCLDCVAESEGKCPPTLKFSSGILCCDVLGFWWLYGCRSSSLPTAVNPRVTTGVFPWSLLHPYAA